MSYIGDEKPISRQTSPFSRPSSVVIMESLAKTLTAHGAQIQQQSERMQQQSEQMQQQQRENMQQQELMHSINSLKDTTLTDISRSQSELYRSQTDLSRPTRLERIERASPELNPVELRTNPSDSNFVFHAVPTQVTAPLATQPSITSEVSEVISPFGRPSLAAEGPQLPRTDFRLSVPRKTRLTSETITFSPVARLREPGSKPKIPHKKRMTENDVSGLDDERRLPQVEGESWTSWCGASGRMNLPKKNDTEEKTKKKKKKPSACFL